MAAIEQSIEDNSNIYWPFGFPRDFLIFCKYFADAALRPTWFQQSSLPCLHTPSSSIFASRTLLYAATEVKNDLIAIETNQTGNEDVIRTGSANKRFFSFASQPYTSRQLCPATPPKRQKADYMAACIELYPQIKNAIGGIGMSLHLIRALTFGGGSASYRHDERCSLRGCRRMVSRIFGMKRHTVIFPHFNSLYLSIPSDTPLAFSIQVAQSSPPRCLLFSPDSLQATARRHIEANSGAFNLSKAIKAGNINTVAAMLDSGITPDSK
jgi:hypothetical protein